MPKQTVKGIPLPVWIGAGLFAVVVGYFFLRTNTKTAGTATDLQGASGTTTDQVAAQDVYAAYLNQNSWLNSYLAMISQELAGIASTQGASAPPNPTPPPKPPDCCRPGMGIACKIGTPYCPPELPHDGSGVISPAQLVKVS